MGYCVEMEMQGVVIPGVKVPGAITALEKLMNATRTTMDAGTIRRHYGWVDTDGVLKALKHGNLVAALSEWRYNAEEGDRMTPVEQLACGEAYCDIVVHYFEGGKWGDDALLWGALAPFVAPGATIEVYGEDRTAWRYVFEGEIGFKEEYGTIVWK